MSDDADLGPAGAVGADDDVDPEPERGTGGGSGPFAPDAGDAFRHLKWGALAVLVLFALVGAVGVYTGVNRTIDIWVARRYQPMVSAGWNLAVLLASLSGIVALLRRLR